MTEKQSNEIVALYQQYAGPMIRLAFLRTADAELSKDLVQEVFWRACCKPADVLERGDKPAQWLFRALEYQTLRALKKSCRAEITLDYDMVAPPLMQPLWELLPVGLTAAEQRILTLRIEQRLAFDVIAAQDHISEWACRKRYTRAVKRCQQLLTRKHGGMYLLFCLGVGNWT